MESHSVIISWQTEQIKYLEFIPSVAFVLVTFHWSFQYQAHMDLDVREAVHYTGKTE